MGLHSSPTLHLFACLFLWNKEVVFIIPFIFIKFIKIFINFFLLSLEKNKKSRQPFENTPATPNI